MSVLSWVGMALNVVGVLVAAYGIRLTWSEHAGEPFFAPVVAPVKRLLRRAEARARELLRRPPRTDVREVRGTLHIGATGSATAQVLWPPLPDVSDPAELRDEVDRRLAWLSDTVQRTQADLAAEERVREQQFRDLDQQTRARLNALEGMTHEVATNGLRWEALGLGLVAVGTVLQALGT